MSLRCYGNSCKGNAYEDTEILHCTEYRHSSYRTCYPKSLHSVRDVEYEMEVKLSYVFITNLRIHDLVSFRCFHISSYGLVT
jgi:hypothetical protein